MQLNGKAPAPPVTIVLDQQGRLAARVVGEVDATTLVGLVQDVQAGPRREPSKAAGEVAVRSR